MPNTLVLIFSIMIVVMVSTWIIPGGEFDRVEKDGRNVLVADSYRQTEHVPQGIDDLFISPLKGFMAAAEIIAFVLIVGGAFTILQKSGAVDSLIGQIIKLQNNRPFIQKLIIPVFMIMFSFFGSVFGMSEEVIPFILIFVPLAVSLGYDSIVGVAVPFIGAGVGFASAFVNPFTLGIAQSIAELEPLSGVFYRILCWIVFTLISIAFIMVYANRIKRNPAKSLLFESDEFWRSAMKKESGNNENHFSIRHKLILITFLLTIMILIAGVWFYKWYIPEIAALFLGMSVLTGLISRLRINELSVEFVKGAADFMNVAFIIALARSILILASDGRIMDTILFYLSELIGGTSPVITAQLMFVVQSVINIFIPSGSGQAVLIMPIMSPLSDLLGVTRQTAVLAFQFGDGLTNLIIPTSGVTMGVLGLARIPYEKWFHWIWPLMILLFLTGFILLIPPVLFNWS
ncbi:MAG: putative basic amino acid antiporter YfcC [Calditrichaceae bacterium]|nr:putative basic amino acid antiporter YfcC [Calditrichaceae bacterium]MBN2709600.1 putative basic amino acid antiporter YfcC [Calditrichaceae bacterium]